MELVSERWYRDLGRAITVLSGGALIASLLAAFWPAFTPMAEEWGMSVVTMALSALVLLYMLVLHPILLRRLGRYGTTLIVTFLFLLNLANLIHSTGQLHSWFHLVWLALVLLCGMFGAYSILGFCFLTALYAVILIADHPEDIPPVDTISLAATLSVLVTGIISYFIWRGQYKGHERSEIAQLTGQLKSTEQQSAILINSIADGIILIKPDGKISLMNPAAATMTEWRIEDANGIEAAVVIKLLQEDGGELTDASNPITHVLAQQQPMDAVLQLTGRNKKALVVSVVVSPVILPKNKEFAGAVAVIRDISEQRAEERRRADFISTASHEMRTPVAAIEGYLALALNDKVSQIDTKARGYLEKAHYSTQHLGQLFQDLLTSAKAEDGRLVSHPVVVEMGSYVEQIADSLKFAAQKKNLLVDFMLGTDSAAGIGGERVVKPLYYVHIDPDRIREVINNLFDNAVKYSEAGKITLGLTGNGEIIQLSIRDTGAGIPAEDIPHLFQKFYRIDNSATRTVGGTGLGLFICRKIVEIYKGRIWVESEVGKGSIFYINLPRLSAARAEELQKQEASQASPLTDAVPIPTNASSATPL